jgi:aryl-alcohol dehydrogenase-like predicted oxidoreductase
MKMKSKTLIADIGKPVSQLALGTAFYDVKSCEKCFDIIDEYIRLGGTIIDSARGYGTSEDVLGLWLDNRSTREQIVIITKCGLTNDGILPSDDYPELVHRELMTSLQTLRTDYIDIYMLHRDNKQMTVAEILEPLNNEIANGRIKVLGASNWEYPRITEANDYANKHGMKGFAVVSNNISLAVQSAPFYPGLISTDKAGERWHEETGIPLIPWSSQARGFFTGKYAPNMRVESTDGFTKRMIEVYCTDENFGRLARANELGKKKGYTAVEVALSWLLHKSFSIVPIVGPQTKEELASCVNAISLTLTEDEVKWLNLH